MNSEKVKDIKKALECMSGVCKDATTVICWDCKVGKKFNDETACKETLNLINELEKENAELKVNLKNSIDMQKQMLDGFETATKEVEENLAREMLNLLKQFAEKVKDSLEEYRLENEYFTEHEPNGNLWQMNSSVFCIEVTQDGGLIDQLAKECLNES